MALPTQPYKGARDFYPEDKRLQKYLFSVLRQAVERFGYEEYDAPILEPLDLYLAKSGEEIVNEQTYSFEDRGGRKVVIRPEMTPTVARMVAARRQELAYPLRWYSLPNLWRYERPQRGRFREHWQLNVDIFGVAGIEAEYEMILVVDAIFRSFGARHEDYTIKLNSRKLMNSLFSEVLKLKEKETSALIKLVDRLPKLERSDFIAGVDDVLGEPAKAAGATEQLLSLLGAKQLKDLPPELHNHQSVAALQQLMDLAENAGIKNVVFDITLMRGFDYYTDIVFEVFDNHPENNRSMMGGGRYDGLVGLFGVAPVATVGFGLGDATLLNFLQLHRLLPDLAPETQVFVALLDKELVEPAHKLLAELSRAGVNLAVGIAGKKLSDQFRVADKKHIPYLLIVGEDELKAGQLTLKHLRTGREHKGTAKELAAIIV